MEAVLHIGTEKTGSTTIQGWLHHGRTRLAAEGVLYPRSVGSRHHRRLQLMAAGPEALGDEWLRMKGIGTAAGFARAVAAWRRDLEQELEGARRAGLGRVIFSSEHLQSRLDTVERVERLRDLLGELGLGPLRAVVYLREQVATAVSLLSTRVLMGATLTEPPDPDAPGWGVVLDHRATVERWSGVLGEDALVVRLLERDALVGGDLLTDWADAAGLRAPSGPPPRPANASLSASAIEVVRRMNVQRPVPYPGAPDAVRERAIEAATVALAAGPPFVPSPELVRDYRERFAEGNEWVRRAWFPRRPSLFTVLSDAPGRDDVPTAHAPDGLDDAALDRIATELLERAEREAVRPPRALRRWWSRVPSLRRRGG